MYTSIKRRVRIDCTYGDRRGRAVSNMSCSHASYPGGACKVIITRLALVITQHWALPYQSALGERWVAWCMGSGESYGRGGGC